MVIIGAGPIGCEFASIYSALGKTKVNLIDKALRILPYEDEDVSLHAQRKLVKRGVTIHHNSLLFDLTPYTSDVTALSECSNAAVGRVTCGETNQNNSINTCDSATEVANNIN
uniref:Dihydrolipoyl dehydrogenase n=1 Tax=Lygus hesperus TaxID=30085 RepID=A0A0A9XIF1_LYGHE